MTRSEDLLAVPEDLPVPQDDGACDHLKGTALPDLLLRSTRGGSVDLSKVPGRAVVYIFPRTGRPDQPLPIGWNTIPGARGCTLQTCAFRDHHAELGELGAAVYGLSTQSPDYQKEMAERLHLPFAVLSDPELKFTRALKLPTFRVDGMRLIKRITLIVHDGIIEHAFYPVFPPEKNAAQVMRWLELNPAH